MPSRAAGPRARGGVVAALLPRLRRIGPGTVPLLVAMLTAMREGKIARVEELTRIPADVQEYHWGTRTSTGRLALLAGPDPRVRGRRALSVHGRRGALPLALLLA